ncbi:glutamate carboxypeptidase 2-like isoform X2 [Dendronephthya gigantea]|uniref:glutamate carboxypeptidase 2-like isoform X2 n=1 Tax=Dendronephthya gigantea TaxID=151771 RepID=UPI00106CE76D|nr:glutamate carboxypeptidase 2-like isoform X2 [Dendronephthya gigantea]
MAVVSLSKGQIVGVVIGVVVLFVLGFVIGWFSAPEESSVEIFNMKYIVKKRREQMRQKHDYHTELLRIINAENIGKNLRYFAKRPHVGGTPRSKELANEIERRWREYKFDKVEQPEYDTLLPYVQPNVSNSVQILNSTGNVTFEFSGKEKLADPSENDTTMIPPFLGYAKQGSVEGELLYVNYGRTEDFQVLKNNFSIANCNGYIVIMRYGKIFRGDKVKHAQDCGAVGAILYNDPADFAPDGQDKVYPNYIWLPKTGVQRGSIFIVPGDPLTPGLPSVEGVFRIPEANAGLPKIPATPMPYGDALRLLEIMEGEDAPGNWQGRLNISYKLGNGGLMNNNTVKIQVNVPNKRQTIYNVIGTIYGKEEPDRWVLIGNHRDAWGFGAVDPSSGTSAMMEISRGVRELLKKGWRPRRTIKFCSWGAEEPGLVGSTEWVEENERVLSTKAITYINVDAAVYGNFTFSVSGSPLLKTTINNNVKEVDDPHGEKVYHQMLRAQKRFVYRNLGSGSDYASFYQFCGVPSVTMTYAGERIYPVYHSVHDTYKWLQGLIDPYFKFHLTTAKIASKVLMYMTDSFVLPINVSEYGVSLESSLETLRTNYGNDLEENNVTLSHIKKAIMEFKKEAKIFEAEGNEAFEEKDDIKLRDLNDRMINVEKAFITAPGLPNRPNTRHVVFAPSVNNAYGSTSFPGISDLMFKENKTEQDWLDIKKQASVLFQAISSATDVLKADA